MTISLVKARNIVLDGMVYCVEGYTIHNHVKYADATYKVHGVIHQVESFETRRMLGGQDMREIKFRAWNKFTNRIECDVLGYNPGFLYEIFNNEQYELMQYTGLKDKNGKEIYEGDVLYGVKPNRMGNWLVFWNKKEAEWSIKSPTGIRFDFHFKLSGLGKREILGNIYENPDLMEETK